MLGFRQCLICYQFGKLSTGYSKLQGPRHHTSFSWNLCLSSFPGGSEGRVCLQHRRPGFNPWIGKIPWKRKWQPTPVFLPGKSHGWRSLAGYSAWGPKESDMTEWLTLSVLCLAIQALSIYSDIRNEVVTTTWVLSIQRILGVLWQRCAEERIFPLRNVSSPSYLSQVGISLTFLSTNSVGASAANNDFPLHHFFSNSDFIDDRPLFHI